MAGTLLVRSLFGRDARAGLVAGVSACTATRCSSHPLVITAYGHDHRGHLLLVGASAHYDDGRHPHRARAGRGRVAGCRCAGHRPQPVRNLRKPIIIGLFAGILWRVTGLPIVGPAETVIASLGDVAATLALVSVGMSLRNYGVSGHVAPVLVVALIKLVAMPAIVFVLVLWVIPLPPLWAKAIVIAAACPTGVNAFLVATRFGTSQALASAAITLTTGLAVVSVAAWLTLVEFAL